MVRLLGAAPRASRWERDTLLLRHNLRWCRRQVTILNLRGFGAARKPFTPQRQEWSRRWGSNPTLPLYQSGAQTTTLQRREHLVRRLSRPRRMVHPPGPVPPGAPELHRGVRWCRRWELHPHDLAITGSSGLRVCCSATSAWAASEPVCGGSTPPHAHTPRSGADSGSRTRTALRPPASEDGAFA